jgi:hypothetical protein
VNPFDSYKHIDWLSVDEFMCLLFGLEPGTVKFDYGDPEDWPKGAGLIYRMLTEGINTQKFYVFFEKPELNPSINEQLGAFLFGEGQPWWNEGKLHKRELVKWLEEKGITSKFFNVLQAPSKNTEQESSIEPTDQPPAPEAVTEGKPMKTDTPLLLNFEEVIDVDHTKITPQLVANNYLLIGILLDFIVGDAKDLTPKKQSELVDLIVEKYYNERVLGVSERNVNKKFAIANKLKKMLDKAKSKFDEALTDTHS